MQKCFFDLFFSGFLLSLGTTTKYLTDCDCMGVRTMRVFREQYTRKKKKSKNKRERKTVALIISLL